TRYTNVPNCAGRERSGNLVTCPARTKIREAHLRVPIGKRETHLIESFSQEAQFYGDNARTETDADLYRKMDSEDFVFAGRKASSSWRVAPPSGKRVAAHADQNAAQSRIHRVSRETHKGIESCCCRVFPDATRKEHHRSTTR